MADIVQQDDWYAIFNTNSDHQTFILALCFSPNNLFLAAGTTKPTITIWDIYTEVVEIRLSGHDASVESLEFSPSGDLLVSGSKDGTVRLWDFQSGECLQKLSSQILEGSFKESEVLSVSFSPDGKVVAAGTRSGAVFLCDVAHGSRPRRLEGGGEPSKCVSFSPNGRKLLSAGLDYSVRLWELSSQGVDAA